jgi:hypothetical protein
MCIVADDYLQWMLKESDTVVFDTRNSSDLEGKDHEKEKNEDNKEEDKETEEKDEKYSNEKKLYLSYSVALKSNLSFKQYALLQSNLNYKNRCHELESPPPEV